MGRVYRRADALVRNWLTDVQQSSPSYKRKREERPALHVMSEDEQNQIPLRRNNFPPSRDHEDLSVDLTLESTSRPRSKKRRTDAALSDASSDHGSSQFSLPAPSTRSTRSNSPTKLMRLTPRAEEPILPQQYKPGQPISDEFPLALAEMWAGMIACSRGKRVIPANLKDEIQRRYGIEAQSLDDSNYGPSGSACSLTVSHFEDLLRGAVKSAGRDEPHWNCASHFPALDRAIETAGLDGTVEVENM